MGVHMLSVVIKILLGMSLGALGNRAWGSGQHAAGVFLMAAAVFFTHGIASLWLLPLVFYWRFASPRPWIHILQGLPEWRDGLLRGTGALPLGAYLYGVTGQWWHLVWAGAMIVWSPTCYWLAGKQKRFEPVAMSELLNGLGL